jgi:hypothetical protein
MVDIQSVPEGKVNILGGFSIGILSKKLCMYMCPIPSDFRERPISLYNSKTVDKKKTLHNTGIYSSSDKVGTVYLA